FASTTLLLTLGTSTGSTPRPTPTGNKSDASRGRTSSRKARQKRVRCRAGASLRLRRNPFIGREKHRSTKAHRGGCSSKFLRIGSWVGPGDESKAIRPGEPRRSPGYSLSSRSTRSESDWSSRDSRSLYRRFWRRVQKRPPRRLEPTVRFRKAKSSALL